MNNLMQFVVVSFGCCLSSMSLAQGKFSNCSAAFVGRQMVVDTYTQTGQCQLPAAATGTLTVKTVTISPTKSKGVEKIDFTLAIRDKATNTLHQYSNKIYRQVPVERVLATCKKGDHIVLLTVDNRYSLPHNEILVK